MNHEYTQFTSRFLTLLIPTLCVLVTGVVYAQDLPPDQGANQAAILRSRVEEKIDEDRRMQYAEPEIEGDIREKPTLSKSQEKFFINKIELSGNEVIDTHELRSVIESYEQREVALADLEALAGDIEWAYREKGYIATYVYLPEQKILNQIVTLNIVEGKLDEVTIEGSKYFKSDKILSYARGQEGKVLKEHELRSVLRAINRNPDREARAILQKGATPETTSMIIKIEDRLPFHVGFFFDNRGNRASGRERFGFNMVHNNLTGRDDILTSALVVGKEFYVLFSRYFVPIPTWDAGLVATASTAQSVPKRDLVSFGVNSLSQSYGLAFQKTLYEDDRYFLTSEFGMDIKESETRVLGDKFRRNQLRSLRFSPELRIEHNKGLTLFENDFVWGVDFLEASIEAAPTAVRQGIQPDYFKYRGYLSHYVRMPQGHRMSIRSGFQLPSTKLPSEEALFLGGASTVRGYPEGDYLADTGFHVNVEYYIPSFFLPKDYMLPGAGQYLWSQIEWYAFYDQAYGRLRGASVREIKDRHLVGTGLGVRARVYQDAYARIELGFALGDDPLTEANRMRFHVGLDVEI